MRIVKVWYNDHHEDTLTLGQAKTRLPACVNACIGEVIYEDADWIRLIIEWSDIDGKDEDYKTMAILKAQIVKIQELSQ